MVRHVCGRASQLKNSHKSPGIEQLLKELRAIAGNEFFDEEHMYVDECLLLGNWCNAVIRKLTLVCHLSSQFGKEKLFNIEHLQTTCCGFRGTWRAWCWSSTGC